VCWLWRSLLVNWVIQYDWPTLVVDASFYSRLLYIILTTPLTRSSMKYSFCTTSQNVMEILISIVHHRKGFSFQSMHRLSRLKYASTHVLVLLLLPYLQEPIHSILMYLMLWLCHHLHDDGAILQESDKKVAWSWRYKRIFFALFGSWGAWLARASRWAVVHWWTRLQLLVAAYCRLRLIVSCKKQWVCKFDSKYVKLFCQKLPRDDL